MLQKQLDAEDVGQKNCELKQKREEEFNLYLPSSLRVLFLFWFAGRSLMPETKVKKDEDFNEWYNKVK